MHLIFALDKQRAVSLLPSDFLFMRKNRPAGNNGGRLFYFL
ncbi:hypothetical protein P262_03800 [Cronobacter malonaticus]|uniref:Uncharacterized protein n=1 Tax=Cronobacter malonaticus TaxID=413503 RepID=V5U1T4_9ENTR|nr:hypothetical protein P262_03800 [Cronobacter malonaticus]